MPSKKNPNTIKSGSGAKSSENKTSFSLDPVKTGSVNTSSPTHAEAQNDHPLGNKQSPLANHLSPSGVSHTASQISIDQKPKETFDSRNVEGALDELSALIPPKPPKIGFERGYMTTSGYPDWGVLKLRDSSILYRESATFLNDNTPSQVYPYYWHPPQPAQKYKPFTPDTDLTIDFDYTPRGEWSEGGDDPQTDITFNVIDGTYSGGGDGKVFSGVFTRDEDGDPLTTNVGMPTLRIYPIGGDTEFGVVLSGMVYPADRGLLALVRYPEGGSVSDFVAQSLDTKVVCAILLGTGILDDCPCDGGVGGIFEVGKDNSGDYDPYSFPGQASGQGDLYEIHTGFVSGSTTVLHSSGSAYYNFDGLSSATFDIVSSTAIANPTYETSVNHTFEIGDIVTIQGHTVGTANGVRKITAKTVNTFTVENVDGTVAGLGGGTGGTVVREIGCHPSDYTVLPYPAQVRLGTDPNSGVTPLANGIPILGATTSARGGGDDNNFFRYRLPYLDDYVQSSSASLKWTESTEQFRYYQKPSVSLNPSTLLDSAGDYANFSKDYFPFQVARYRHRFIVDSCACAPGITNGFDLGSYALIHFKKEEYFEEFVRDGVIPTADKIYSASLSDFSNIENLDNVVKDSSIEGVSTSYHTVRSTLFGENGDGVVAPTVANNNFTIVRTLDEVMRVSGVAYFYPTGNLSLTQFRTDIIGLFENTYKNTDLASEKLNMANPVMYSLGAFSWSALSPSDTPSFTSTLGYPRYQRLELDLEDLGYTLASPPNITDSVSVNLDISLLGDVLNPSFSADTRSRLFFRRPIGHETNTTTVLPYNGLSINSADGKTMLYHSSQDTGLYGNFQVNPGVDTTAKPSTVAIQKWSSERFLDEVFRYDSTFSAIKAVDLTLGTQLAGPGLPLSGAITPIEIPVRAGVATNVSATELWADSSWLQQDKHLASLGGTTELQVSGLPHRNPPLAEGCIYPVPTNGMLRYPNSDYTTNHRPSVADSDITNPQFDYSAETGVRGYVRVLSLNSSYIGKSIAYLKIDGLELQDFAYSPPNSGSEHIAIFVKVPGMTTWLDIGRRDGDGPSKQDPLLDGGGCQVLGEDTVNAYDPHSGHRYCTVKINVGSTANFFRMVEGTTIICPLMIKVVYYDTAIAKYYDFAHKVDLTTRIPTGTIDENANTRDVRALIGISITTAK